jgi:hypothetical protein
MIVGSGQCDLYTAGAAALKVRGELPGRSARGRDAANPCGSLQKESQILLRFQCVSLEQRNCSIVRFFKMGLLPLTAIVPVFDQGSGRVESRRCRFNRRSPVAAEPLPEYSKCARAQPSLVILAVSIKVGHRRILPPSARTRGKRVRGLQRDFPLETARYRVD